MKLKRLKTAVRSQWGQLFHTLTNHSIQYQMTDVENNTELIFSTYSFPLKSTLNSPHSRTSNLSAIWLSHYKQYRIPDFENDTELLFLCYSFPPKSTSNSPHPRTSHLSAIWLCHVTGRNRMWKATTGTGNRLVTAVWGSTVFPGYSTSSTPDPSDVVDQCQLDML